MQHRHFKTQTRWEEFWTYAFSFAPTASLRYSLKKLHSSIQTIKVTMLQPFPLLPSHYNHNLHHQTILFLHFIQISLIVHSSKNALLLILLRMCIFLLAFVTLHITKIMYGNIIIIIIVNPLNSSQHYEPLHKFTKLLFSHKQLESKTEEIKGKVFKSRVHTFVVS